MDVWMMEVKGHDLMVELESWWTMNQSLMLLLMWLVWHKMNINDFLEDVVVEDVKCDEIMINWIDWIVMETWWKWRWGVCFNLGMDCVETRWLFWKVLWLMICVIEWRMKMICVIEQWMRVLLDFVVVSCVSGTLWHSCTCLRLRFCKGCMEKCLTSFWWQGMALPTSWAIRTTGKPTQQPLSPQQVRCQSKSAQTTEYSTATDPKEQRNPQAQNNLKNIKASRTKVKHPNSNQQFIPNNHSEIKHAHSTMKC